MDSPVTTKQSGIQKILWRTPHQEIHVVTSVHDASVARRLQEDQPLQLRDRYKPKAIRTGVLICLIVLACGLMGALGGAATKLMPWFVPGSEYRRRDAMNPVVEPIAARGWKIPPPASWMSLKRSPEATPAPDPAAAVMFKSSADHCQEDCLTFLREAAPAATPVQLEMPETTLLLDRRGKGVLPLIDWMTMPVKRSDKPQDTKGDLAGSPDLHDWITPPNERTAGSEKSQEDVAIARRHIGDLAPPEISWMDLPPRSASGKFTPLKDSPINDKRYVNDLESADIKLDINNSEVAYPGSDYMDLGGRDIKPDKAHPTKDYMIIGARAVIPDKSSPPKDYMILDERGADPIVTIAELTGNDKGKPFEDYMVIGARDVETNKHMTEEDYILIAAVEAGINGAGINGRDVIPDKEMPTKDYMIIDERDFATALDARNEKPAPPIGSWLIYDEDLPSGLGERDDTSKLKLRGTPETVADKVKLVAVKSAADVFAGSYLPTLVALTYAAIWAIIDVKVMRMEPFYQLSKPQGGKASDTIAFSYFTCNTFSAPIYALYHKHWAVLCSSMAYLVTSIIIPPIAADTITIEVNPYCTKADFMGCTGVFVFRTSFSYGLYILFSFTVFMALCLIFLLWNRRTGVNANPSSIAGLATAFNGNDILHHLRQMDPEASDKELKNELKDKHCQLLQSGTCSPMSSYSTQSSYDKKTGAHSPDVLSHAMEREIGRVLPQKPIDRRQVLAYAMVVCAGLFMIFLLSVIIWYYKNSAQSPLEIFMDSQGLGVRALWVLFGVIIKVFWQRIERAAQVSEPYVQLLKGQAHPSHTILVVTSSTPVESFIFAAKHRYFYLAIVSFTSFLAEIITVLLPAIPYSDAELYFAFQATTFFSVGILSFMLAVLVWVLFRVHVLSTLPRSPETIAGQLSYLCGSNMMADFRDLKDLDGERRDAMVRSWGKRYTFGWMPGVDGVSRWAIDEEQY